MLERLKEHSKGFSEKHQTNCNKETRRILILFGQFPKASLQMASNVLT